MFLLSIRDRRFYVFAQSSIACHKSAEIAFAWAIMFSSSSSKCKPLLNKPFA